MADTPDTAQTTVALGRPDTLLDRIDTAGDADWFRLDLKADQAITIEVTRLSPVDPYLEIRDSAGMLLLSDDDGGAFTDALLSFRAADTGTFFVSVFTSPVGNPAVTGDYRITTTIGGTGPSLVSGGTAALPTVPPPVTPEPPPPVDQPFRPAPQAPAGPLASIMGDTVLADTVVTVYFGRAGESFGGVTGEGFNAYERARFDAAFAQIEAVADLEFQVVTSAAAADFRLVLDTNEMPVRTLGYFYAPGEENLSGIGVFNGAAFDRRPGGNLEAGGEGAATIVHELLHGLGLMHPHDTGAGSTIMPGVRSDFYSYGAAALNQGIFTTMSYNPGYQTGTGTSPLSDVAGQQYGPMALDIAALQLIYGASGHATGSDIYRLPGADGLGVGWQAIWDTGGVDRMVFDGTRNATLDLRAATLDYGPGGGGFVSGAAFVSGGFTIAAGVVIEQAYGGFGQDRVIGNSANNTLLGRNGNDVLMGLNGHDILNGGNGRDIVQGGDGSDRVFGQAGDDVLFGDAGFDLLHGGQGRDVFIYRRITDSLAPASQRDAIADFTRGQDRINFAPLDGHLGQSGNQAFDFIGGAAFNGADGQGDVRIHRLDHGGVIVAVDQDGDGYGDMQIVVQGVQSLTAADFIL